MALVPGARLGPYEVLERLGGGGMGDVYRARDTRLERTVAIKVIKPERMTEPHVRLRFEREARAVAALSHPNICHLNDVGQQDSVDFLVMEYVKGETLAIRLSRAGGALPLDETLHHGIEIAEALAAAHQQGIVHRDLKPGNVMLTATGVKLLDFGLAKLPDSPQGALGTLSTLSPTQQNPLTSEGSILGTWPYMAPEQVEGKAVDARADIFAFGAVLYEMATGRRASEGDTHASLIAAILEREPVPLVERDVAAPPALDRIVRKCLAKSPDARWQSARDLADALKWLADERSSSKASGPVARADTSRPSPSRWRTSAAAAAILAVGLAVGAAGVWTVTRPTEQRLPLQRFEIYAPPDANGRMADSAFALSPDGRALAYVGITDGKSSLHLRSLDQRDARVIPGTEGGALPTFSPDSQWIAFFVGDTLKKVSRGSGAPPITLAEFPGLAGNSIAWLPDNTIALGRVKEGLFRVPAEGGTPAKFSTTDAGQNLLDLHNPRGLPGSQAMLVTTHRQDSSGRETFDVAALDGQTGRMHPLVSDAFAPWYAASGHLVFARGQTLLAAPFDVERLAVTGPPVVLVDAIYTVPGSGDAAFAVSEDGILSYMPAIDREARRLGWLGTDGAVNPLPVEPRGFWRPTLSPDGARVAVEISKGDNRDIWICDVESGGLTPLTSDGVSTSPVWTPDGKSITFSKAKDGRREVYSQPVDGAAPPERLITDTQSVLAGSWSPDGRTLAFVRVPPSDQTDIGLLDRPARVSKLAIAGVRPDQQPRFSPDGRWLAYATSESKRSEVMVASRDGTLSRKVSVDGGSAPVWQPDGRTLFYRTGSGGLAIMAVDVSRFPATIGKPNRVIEQAPFPFNVGGPGHPGYDAAADGRLLVVLAAPEERAFLRLEVVVNWFEELKQRAPAK